MNKEEIRFVESWAKSPEDYSLAACIAKRFNLRQSERYFALRSYRGFMIRARDMEPRQDVDHAVDSAISVAKEHKLGIIRAFFPELLRI